MWIDYSISAMISTWYEKMANYTLRSSYLPSWYSSIDPRRLWLSGLDIPNGWLKNSPPNLRMRGVAWDNHLTRCRRLHCRFLPPVVVLEACVNDIHPAHPDQHYANLAHRHCLFWLLLLLMTMMMIVIICACVWGVFVWFPPFFEMRQLM